MSDIKPNPLKLLKRDNIKSDSKLTFTSQPKKHKLSDSRFLITIIKAENLLASDAETGKSDPICFVWCGLPDNVPSLSSLSKMENIKDIEKIKTNELKIDSESGELADDKNYIVGNENNIQMTKVLKERIDPYWNEEKIFFLNDSYKSDLMDMKCVIFVRDEDINTDKSIGYDELGMVEIPFKDIITLGNVSKTGFKLTSKWYNLIKTPTIPPMGKIDGRIQLTTSLVFSDKDLESLYKILAIDIPEYRTDIEKSKLLADCLQQLKLKFQPEQKSASRSVSPATNRRVDTSNTKDNAKVKTDVKDKSIEKPVVEKKLSSIDENKVLNPTKSNASEDNKSADNNNKIISDVNSNKSINKLNEVSVKPDNINSQKDNTKEVKTLLDKDGEKTIIDISDDNKKDNSSLFLTSDTTKEPNNNTNNNQAESPDVTKENNNMTKDSTGVETTDNDPIVAVKNSDQNNDSNNRNIDSKVIEKESDKARNDSLPVKADLVKSQNDKEPVVAITDKSANNDSSSEQDKGKNKDDNNHKTIDKSSDKVAVAVNDKVPSDSISVKTNLVEPQSKNELAVVVIDKSANNDSSIGKDKVKNINDNNNKKEDENADKVNVIVNNSNIINTNKETEIKSFTNENPNLLKDQEIPNKEGLNEKTMADDNSGQNSNSSSNNKSPLLIKDDKSTKSPNTNDIIVNDVNKNNQVNISTVLDDNNNLFSVGSGDNTVPIEIDDAVATTANNSKKTTTSQISNDKGIKGDQTRNGGMNSKNNGKTQNSVDKTSEVLKDRIKNNDESYTPILNKSDNQEDSDSELIVIKKTKGNISKEDNKVVNPNSLSISKEKLLPDSKKDKEKLGKTGLKVVEVSEDHFSSGIVSGLDRSKFNLVIRFINGEQLLASDIETGKSDPICFVWCGSTLESSPKLDDLDNESKKVKDCRVVTTNVCYTTTNPIWNEDIVYPLNITDLNTLGNFRVLVYVRDEDINKDKDGKTETDEYGNSFRKFDELGMVEIMLKDIITTGKPLKNKNSIVKTAAWYDLKKSPGMRKIDGRIKFTLSLMFPNNKNNNIELSECLQYFQNKLKPSSSAESLVLTSRSKATPRSSSGSPQRKVVGELSMDPLQLNDSGLLSKMKRPSTANDKVNKNKLNSSSNRPKTAPTISSNGKSLSNIDEEISIIDKDEELINGSGEEDQNFMESEDEQLDILDFVDHKTKANLTRALPNNSKVASNIGSTASNSGSKSSSSENLFLPGPDDFLENDIDNSSVAVAPKSKGNKRNSDKEQNEQVSKKGKMNENYESNQQLDDNFGDNDDELELDNGFAGQGNNYAMVKALRAIKIGLSTLSNRLEKIESNMSSTNIIVEELNNKSKSKLLSKTSSIIPTKSKSLIAKKKSITQPIESSKWDINDGQQEKYVKDDKVRVLEKEIERLKSLPKQKDKVYFKGPGGEKFDQEIMALDEIPMMPPGDQSLPDNDNEPLNFKPPPSKINSPKKAKEIPVIIPESINQKFSKVLETGHIAQIISVMMELNGPKPEELSFSNLNQLFNAIALIITQYSEHVERCLIWIVAVVKNKNKLINQLVGHTKRNLIDSLENISKEKSKRGLLASLLKSQLNKN